MDTTDIVVPPVARVRRTGVVNLDFGQRITVDSDDMVREIYAQVEQMKPKSDYHGNFAAIVSLTVTFLGEMEEDDSVGP